MRLMEVRNESKIISTHNTETKKTAPDGYQKTAPDGYRLLSCREGPAGVENRTQLLLSLMSRALSPLIYFGNEIQYNNELDATNYRYHLILRGSPWEEKCDQQKLLSDKIRVVNLLFKGGSE